MAHNVLTIPVAAVRPERVFSTGRALINYRRNRLKGETIKNLLVLKSQINKILKKEIWSDDHDFGDYEISEERKKQDQEVKDDKKNTLWFGDVFNGCFYKWSFASCRFGETE